MEFISDVYSYSNPEQVLVKHVEIDWDISFNSKIIKGEVTLHLTKHQSSNNYPLILDSKDLKILQVQYSYDNKIFVPVNYTLGTYDSVKGQSLTISLPPLSNYVRINYLTKP